MMSMESADIRKELLLFGHANIGPGEIEAAFGRQTYCGLNHIFFVYICSSS
jgi:hypothetical protein